MIRLATFCDFCEQEMKEEHVDEHDVDVVKLHKTNGFDTKKIFPHLCKRCADKLDSLYSYIAATSEKKRRTAEFYKKLNEWRKNDFNTDG